MTNFGAALRSVVLLYGGTRAAAKRLGVSRWTLYRWCAKTSADTMQVVTLARLTSAFPELKVLLDDNKETDT